MRKSLPIIAVTFASVGNAGDAELVLMLGEIEEVKITAVKPPPAKDRKALLDHSCGNEVVKFNIEEYVTGKGESTVILSRVLPSYNCEPSWPGLPVSASLAMQSKFAELSIFRGIVQLVETDQGLVIVDDISDFLRVANIHAKVDPNKLLEKLNPPIPRYWELSQGVDELNYLQELGVLKYKTAEIDLNDNCISGCKKGNFVLFFEVTFLKGIPLSRLRSYDF